MVSNFFFGIAARVRSGMIFHAESIIGRLLRGRKLGFGVIA